MGNTDTKTPRTVRSVGGGLEAAVGAGPRALAEDVEAALSEQVTSLSEHVQVLAAQVETLTENMVQLGGHVTVLANAYEGLQKSVNEMINVSNAVVRKI